MSKPLSERRLAENEVFFRQANEKAAQGFETLKKIAEEDDQTSWLQKFDQPIRFYCECSNEDCRKRILLEPSKYFELHKNSNQFVLLPNHSIPSIERVVKNEHDFIVVEKLVAAPRKASKLNSTKDESE